MDKYELIFSAIIIIAYIICSVTLKIPFYIHLMFGTIILGALIIALLLKFKKDYENEKISKIFRALSIIFIICYGLMFIYEMIYHKPFFVASGFIILLILITEIISWVLRKNSD